MLRAQRMRVARLPPLDHQQQRQGQPAYDMGGDEEEEEESPMKGGGDEDQMDQQHLQDMAMGGEEGEESPGM